MWPCRFALHDLLLPLHTTTLALSSHLVLHAVISDDRDLTPIRIISLC